MPPVMSFELLPDQGPESRVGDAMNGLVNQLPEFSQYCACG